MTDVVASPTTWVFIGYARVKRIREHAQALLEAHARELEPDLADGLKPDWHAYEVMEAANQLIVLTAQIAGEPDIVGYAVASLSNHPHYDLRVCQHGLLYVEPKWRGRSVGLLLIDKLRAEAKARGADRLVMHAKTGTKLEKLLPRLGFKTEETVFVEDLCRTP